MAQNAEGSVLPSIDVPADEVDRYAGRQPTQAAGAALLRLAWHHPPTLLARAP